MFLVDDGSTDGTAEAIQAAFPQVQLIKGNGSLFWNRGMLLAWESALDNSRIFDFFLLLNDDTYLYNDSLQRAANFLHLNAILVGSTQDSEGKLSYGGYKDNLRTLANTELQDIDSFDGNFVLVPNVICKKIGKLDYHFRHALGDLEYGKRAIKAGFKIYLIPEYIGTCEPNHGLPSWANSQLSLLKRLKNLYSPKSGCDPREFCYLDFKYHGLNMMILHFFSIHFRVFFPRFYNYVRNLR